MKTKSNKRMIFVGSIFCMIFFISILFLQSTKVEAKEITSLKLADGSLGSYWYSYTTTLTEILRKKMPEIEITVNPGAGNSNVLAVNMGKAQLGMTTSPGAYGGYMGKAPFKEKTMKIRQVVGLADNPLSFVVWADSDIKKITDFKGKRLNVTPRGYTGEGLARNILKAYGMSYKDLKKAEHASNRDGIGLMKDGHLDGMVIMAGRYSSYILDLSSSKPIRIIPIDASIVSKLNKENSGIIPYQMPAAMYKQKKDISTMAAWLTLIAAADLPESLVYKITKTLIENISVLQEFSKGTRDLTPKLMAIDLGFPYHSGALKYFKEKGLR